MSRLPVCVMTGAILAGMTFYSLPSEGAQFTLTGASFPLWPEGAPQATGPGAAHIPTLTIYLPPAERATGAAIVVCPGGGYSGLALDHEGEQVAQWLISEGIAAFVLQYRHAPLYKHPVPLMDAQRAVRTVRARGSEWRVASDRIGILGFSAGGHLAATASTQFAAGEPNASDPIERVSSRPDFMVLVYPVISMIAPYSHAGSRTNLLGPNPDRALMEKLSAELQASKDTPPAFLVHTYGDTGVPAENSVYFYLAMRKAGAPAEMHLFERGEHGFGLAQNDPVLSAWPKLCIAWLRDRGWLDAPK